MSQAMHAMGWRHAKMTDSERIAQFLNYVEDYQLEDAKVKRKTYQDIIDKKLEEEGSERSKSSTDSEGDDKDVRKAMYVMDELESRLTMPERINQYVRYRDDDALFPHKRETNK